MARRRSAGNAVSYALEIGLGMAVLAGVVAGFLFKRPADESIRLALLSGGIGFGVWLSRPLLDWLIDRADTQMRATERWWRKRRNGLLLGLTCFGIGGLLAYYGARLGLAESAIVGGVAGAVGLILWWLLPLFHALGQHGQRLWRWLRRARPSSAPRPRSDTRRPTTAQGLERFSPLEFEELCAEIGRAWGYQARRVGESGDGGIDVEMWRDGQYVVGQCKHYPHRTVPIGHVRDFYGAMMHRGSKRGYFFTSGRFTEGTYKWVAGKNIQLVDGLYIERILKRLDRGERIARPELMSHLPLR